MTQETRKYVSWLNGQASGPIASFGYFRPIVDEVAEMDTSADYWRYIGESLDKYERAWFAQTAEGGEPCSKGGTQSFLGHGAEENEGKVA
jgi:hypothetical protein